MFSFYIPWKKKKTHQKTEGFQVYSGGKKWVALPEMC